MMNTGIRLLLLKQTTKQKINLDFVERKRIIMSMYDNPNKDDIFEKMSRYIEEHGMSEFFQVLADVIRYSEMEG